MGQNSLSSAPLVREEECCEEVCAEGYGAVYPG